MPVDIVHCILTYIDVWLLITPYRKNMKCNLYPILAKVKSTILKLCLINSKYSLSQNGMLTGVLKTHKNIVLTACKAYAINKQ